MTARTRTCYRRRDPTATPLYPLVQHHVETFLADAPAADPDGEAVPQWVEDDFRAYLRCGIVAHGFARIRCDAFGTWNLLRWNGSGGATTTASSNPSGTCPQPSTRGHTTTVWRLRPSRPDSSETVSAKAGAIQSSC
ncbi:hypothetical protein BH23GEM9_BH23GEM9_26830 [soil metagenome]